MTRLWRRRGADPPVAVSSRGVAAPLLRAREILLEEGPEAMLEWIEGHADVTGPDAITQMHAVVWNHHARLSDELLARPFLDAVWCQCTPCGHTWLVSPLAPRSGGGDGSVRGVTCRGCGRTFCPRCARAAQGPCPCGGTFETVNEPNGRMRAPRHEASKRAPEPETPPTDETPGRDRDLDLYFGADGTIPVGVDLTFPQRAAAPAADHLAWAETLAEAGVYYQAQCQLDVLPGTSGRAQWLQARIDIVKLRNAIERERWDYSRTADRQALRDGIDSKLQAAVAADPDLGAAWLTGAQVFLDRAIRHDPERALEWATRARELLGDDPATLLALGRALRVTGEATDAVAVLELIPAGSEEAALAREDLRVARLAARTARERFDAEVHAELGYQYISNEEFARARELFVRLREQCPERGDGASGLATLELLSRDPVAERVARAHRFATDAVRASPRLGRAHEVLGRVHRIGKYASNALPFALEDPLPHFRRALECDPDREFALWAVAEQHLDAGELEPAVELLERAVAVGTQNEMVYLTLAVVYRGKRDFRKQEEMSLEARRLTTNQLTADYENRILSLCQFEY